MKIQNKCFIRIFIRFYVLFNMTMTWAYTYKNNYLILNKNVTLLSDNEWTFK